MRAIDIGNKKAFYTLNPVRSQSLSHHLRAEITAPDTDIDDIPDPFAGIAPAFAAVDRVTEFFHFTQHAFHTGHHIPALDQDGLPGKISQRGMQHRSLFRFIDRHPAEQGLCRICHPAFFRQLQQQAHRLPGDDVPGIIKYQVGQAKRIFSETGGVIPEQVAHMHLLHFHGMILQ